MPSKVMSGARAKLGVVDSSSGIVRFFGIYESVSYGLTLDVASAYVLGRFTCASLDYVSVEPVQVNCTGYRVVDHGPHSDGRVPIVQDLLTVDYMTLVVVDRLTLKPVATIRDVRPTGYTGGFAARQLSQISVSYQGIIVDSEDGENAERFDSTQLP